MEYFLILSLAAFITGCVTPEYKVTCTPAYAPSRTRLDSCHTICRWEKGIIEFKNCAVAFEPSATKWSRSSCAELEELAQVYPAVVRANCIEEEK
jgi:hypothetical protein